MTNHNATFGFGPVTRGGEQVRIYATDGCDPCPIHGAIKASVGWVRETWKRNGGFSIGQESPHDLIPLADHAATEKVQADDGGPSPMPELSGREYAAIKLRVPNSGTSWLDDMIREARRLDYAQQSIEAIIATQSNTDVMAAFRQVSSERGETMQTMTVRLAFSYADAMLAAGKAVNRV